MGGVWIIFHQPPLRVHLIPPFIHSCQLNNDPGLGAAGQRLLVADSTHLNSVLATSLPLFFPPTFPVFPLLASPTCSRKTVNESINGRAANNPSHESQPHKQCWLKNIFFLSLILFVDMKCVCWVREGDNCGTGLIPRLWKAAAVLHQGSKAGLLLQWWAGLLSSNAYYPLLLFSTILSGLPLL